MGQKAAHDVVVDGVHVLGGLAEYYSITDEEALEGYYQILLDSDFSSLQLLRDYLSPVIYAHGAHHFCSSEVNQESHHWFAYRMKEVCVLDERTEGVVGNGSKGIAVGCYVNDNRSYK
ncbi:hypothetical protein RJ640_011034 [Escallonia rubra]|uniref:Uncharacterized protein n=1 Tax=Escallonia rubra TaxID=112253 RepID=A0AA88RCC7_9ASTE|nr:hypothetical protein RJ640_011034 [Escallonia rubra]